MTQISKKEYKNVIVEILNKFNCPYCGKKFKSTSGRTLHYKTCAAMIQAKEDMALCVVGDEAAVKGKNRQTMYIEDGLAILSDGTVISVSDIHTVKAHYAKIEAAKRNRSQAVIADVGWVEPYEDVSTFDRWLENTISRCLKREQLPKTIPAYITMLFRLNSYTKHKGWNREWADSAKLEKHIEKEMKSIKKAKI